MSAGCIALESHDGVAVLRIDRPPANAICLETAREFEVVFATDAIAQAPALVITALFSFMTAWNEFILAATFLNDEKEFTLPVALQRQVGEYATDWGHFAAGSVMTSVVVMALFFALQKHLVGGLTSGSVKG